MLWTKILSRIGELPRCMRGEPGHSPRATRRLSKPLKDSSPKLPVWFLDALR